MQSPIILVPDGMRQCDCYRSLRCGRPIDNHTFPCSSNHMLSRGFGGAGGSVRGRHTAIDAGAKRGKRVKKEAIGHFGTHRKEMSSGRRDRDTGFSRVA